MMKRLVMIFVFLTSTTYSGISVSNDVDISQSTNQSKVGQYLSWVVKDDEIYFCTALNYGDGIVSCIKAKETDSK